VLKRKLTTCNCVLEKLTVIQQVKKYPTVWNLKCHYPMFTVDRHWFIS